MDTFQKSDTNNFIQRNPPPDEASKHALRGKNFLQSNEWRKFQEATGKKTYNISGDNFQANIIEHKLPIVGRYFYVPRGPAFSADAEKIFNSQFSIFNDKIRKKFIKLVDLAKENKAGWVRIEPNNQRILELIQGLIQGFCSEIRKAPHDMQARQVFVIDISKPEEELLAQMKAKVRYNIRLAKKKDVSVRVISKRKAIRNMDSRLRGNDIESGNDKKRYADEFLRLVKVTSERNKIKSHPENYYRKMLETIPEENLKLYAAEYKGKIIAANLVSFYGGTATYLHGASDNKYRNVMAPFLLQWQIMLDAKKKGCEGYDMGGIKMQKSKCKNQNDNAKLKNLKVTQATSDKLQADWAGITRFKLGFSPKTKPVEFPGSYDIVINPWRYWIYRMLQKVKSCI